MAITENQFKRAQKRGEKALEDKSYAVSAKYSKGNIEVLMASNMQILFPVTIVPDLGGATPAQLSDIEIISSGLGLHWPQLDVDLYVPSLLQGSFGRSTSAMALGSIGGKAKTLAKAKAARENGRKGGRPRQKSVT